MYIVYLYIYNILYCYILISYYLCIINAHNIMYLLNNPYYNIMHLKTIIEFMCRGSWLVCITYHCFMLIGKYVVSSLMPILYYSIVN